MDNGSKTERATPRKKEDERKKGNIFQSKDITNSVTLLGIAYLFKLGGNWLFGTMERVMREGCASLTLTQTLTVKEAAGFMANFSIDMAVLIVPVAAASMFMGLALTGVQTRFLFTPSLLGPKLSRINPLSGLKNLFSPKTVVELLKSIIKVTIIGLILYSDISARLSAATLSPLINPESSMRWLAEAESDRKSVV